MTDKKTAAIERELRESIGLSAVELDRVIDRLVAQVKQLVYHLRDDHGITPSERVLEACFTLSLEQVLSQAKTAKIKQEV